jgi:Lipase (class 3)
MVDLKDGRESDNLTLLTKSFDDDPNVGTERRLSDFDIPGDNDRFEEVTVGYPSSLNAAVSLSHNYKGYTRLEVMHGRDIDSLVFIFNILTALCLLYALVLFTLSRTAFAQKLDPVPGIVPDGLSSYSPPPSYVAVESIASLLTFVLSIILFTLYTRRILLSPVAMRTSEQSWIILQLLGIILYLNPYEAIIRFRRDVVGNFDPEQFNMFITATQVANGFSMVSFTTLSLLYVWTSIRSYGILSGDVGKSFQVGIFLPRMCLVLVGPIYKLVFFIGLGERRGLYFSEMPLLSFFGMLNLYSRAKIFPVDEVVISTILFIYESVLVLLIGRDFYKTKHLLAQSDYVKNRTKQVGFRFFAYLNLLFYSIYILTYVIQLLAMPCGPQVIGLLAGNMADYGIQYIPFGLSLFLLGYAAIQAYVSLPADAQGFQGWFKASPGPKTSAELEPILYRIDEPPSMPSSRSVIAANCFTMQTHVDLFNIAWYAYYHGTAKAEKLNLDFSRSSMRFTCYVSAKDTDTHCVIFESPDRILICFKGTSSTKNMSTDMKMKQSSVLNAVPTACRPVSHPETSFVDDILVHSENFEDEPRSFLNKLSPAYLRAKMISESIDRLVDPVLLQKAKIHTGFAAAYRSIAHELIGKVSSMMQASRRPIYMSGHSLGGALATICSLDLALSIRMERNEMLVSTFGSPKVGNESFRDLYNIAVPINWRIVAGGDMISRLPKAGYSHVGKKVLLTPDGELFIDPDSLEVKLWHTMPASLAYHRKSSYLLSMRAWCFRYHGQNFIPNFWPFPISADDSRRFEQIVSMKFKTGMPHSAIGPVSSKKRELPRAERMQAWANLIDQLHGPESVKAGLPSTALTDSGQGDAHGRGSVQLWIQLVKPVVEYLKSTKSESIYRERELVGSDSIYVDFDSDATQFDDGLTT